MRVPRVRDRSPRLCREDAQKLSEAYEAAQERLLAERVPGGYWVGELSSSALATATAVSALSVVSRERFGYLIGQGLKWLRSHQNADGGWGDTPTSPSNLPTTMLVQAACRLGEHDRSSLGSDCLEDAEGYVRRACGPSSEDRIRALGALYGEDRTFAAPILANCALAGDQAPLGDASCHLPRIDWEDVPQLPFELACLSPSSYRWLRLEVVSYALPALIAIGQLVYTRRGTPNPLLGLVRHFAVGPTLQRLEAIQPAGGGFLEAVPLTSFVVMSLAAAGKDSHAVCSRGVAFLRGLARPDGSWPIDSNLSIWLTTLAVDALTGRGHCADPDLATVAEWLLACQHHTTHPYTSTPPGGWAWTHLPGGVPDADDTAGALLALARLGVESACGAAQRGVRWLLGLQNADGGWPTFCRGWGRLPFDRSAPDLTAHAVRAIGAWSHCVETRRRERAIARGFDYLRGTQRPDGSWTPLWFGNQQAPEHENRVHGTARVLAAYPDFSAQGCPEACRGVQFLLRTQNADGSWGGDKGVPGSIEETGLAVSVLSEWGHEPAASESCLRGARYLAERVAEEMPLEPSPIGLYFARLWYSEKLYPLIWTVAALGKVLSGRVLEPPDAALSADKLLSVGKRP